MCHRAGPCIQSSNVRQEDLYRIVASVIVGEQPPSFPLASSDMLSSVIPIPSIADVRTDMVVSLIARRLNAYRAWATYHLHTAYLFTRSDFKTILFPIVSLVCPIQSSCSDVTTVYFRLCSRPSALGSPLRPRGLLDMDTPAHVQRIQSGSGV